MSGLVKICYRIRSSFIDWVVFLSMSVIGSYFVVLILGACIFIGAAFVGFILDLFDEMRNTFGK